MARSNHDFLFKILILGDSSVGKSCILTRFSDDVFNHSFMPTIGIDFKIKTLEINNKAVKLQIWDTAGQERFNNITESYYRTAKGVMFVYDITNGESFDNVAKWLRNLEQNTAEETVKYIIGNKCDLQDIRVINHTTGLEMATNFGLKFYETSAKTNINIQKIFYDMAKDLTAKEEVKRLTAGENTNITVAETRTGNNRPGYLPSCC